MSDQGAVLAWWSVGEREMDVDDQLELAVC